MQSERKYFVGVDGGGTKCRAEVFDTQGRSLGAGVAGPANVARQPEVARQSIINAVSAALADAGLTELDQLRQTAVGAGLAGANLPTAAAELNSWHHPFNSFCFTSDLHAAILGAHAGNNGAALIVGTGSCAASIHNGVLTQLGGHGFVLGDKGSGAWIGRNAVLHTLEAIDGVVSRTALTDQVCQHYRANTSLDLVDRLNQAPPALFGELAPLVLSLAGQGDLQARDIIQTGADYLTAIARKALQQSGGKLVLVGGVAEAITPWLAEDVQQAITPALHGPEWGAVYNLQKLQQESNL